MNPLHQYTLVGRQEQERLHVLQILYIRLIFYKRQESFKLLLIYFPLLFQFKNKLSVVYANCTGIKNSKTIFQRIAAELKIKPTDSNEKDYKLAIETHIRSKHKMM